MEPLPQPPDPIQLPQPVSLLMPVCNEALVIRQVIEEWHRDVMRHLPSGSELVLDDGDSTDGTREILAELCQQHAYLRVLYSPRDGFAAAARRLYQAARCPWVFFTDSDGQYVAREFWKLAVHMDRADMVHGVKAHRRDPALRRAASWTFNRIAQWYFRVTVADINSAFRLLRREVVDTVLPEVHHMPTLLNAELLLRAIEHGFVVRAVPVAHRMREHGGSRGLPAWRFLHDSLRAHRGLRGLRRELRTARPGRPPAQSVAAP